MARALLSMTLMRARPTDPSAAWAMIGAVLFALAAAHAWGHLVFSGAYPHMSHGASIVLDAVLSALWLFSALTLVFGLRGLAPMCALGVVASLAHGAGLSVVSPLDGLPFVLAAPLEAIAVWKALQLTHGPGAVPAHR